MRIAAFLSSYPPLRFVGAELMTATLLEALASRGHTVTAYLDSETEPFVRNGVQVQSRSFFDVRRMRTDVVISHPDLGSVAFVAAGITRSPYVGIVHNVGARNTRSLNQYPPDLIVWNAEATREAHAGSGGLIVRSPLVVSEHARPKGSKPGSLSLVNLTPSKGSQTFYSLAASLPTRSFIGVRGGWGAQEESGGIGALGNVEILDPIAPEDMSRLLWSRTRVLLAPSVEESWGRVAVEALCSGIPVIAHPTNGLIEALGDSAIFVDRADVPAWQEAIERLDDPSEYSKASKRAKARAKSLEELTRRDLDSWISAVESLK
jgi:hypothetical protein